MTFTPSVFGSTTVSTTVSVHAKGTALGDSSESSNVGIINHLLSCLPKLKTFFDRTYEVDEKMFQDFGENTIPNAPKMQQWEQVRATERCKLGALGKRDREQMARDTRTNCGALCSHMCGAHVCGPTNGAIVWAHERRETREHTAAPYVHTYV